MDIRILNPVYCEIPTTLAKIIEPAISFTAVHYRQGMYKKIRKEYQKSTAINIGQGKSLFLTGLLPRVVDFCKKGNIPISVLGKPKLLPFVKPKLNNINFREEQERVVLRALNAQRGAIVSFTGSGKTAMGVGIIAGFLPVIKDFKALWLCHTKDLMYQSAEVCQKELSITPGIIGDGNADLNKQITMATRQSFINLVEEYGHLYDLILVDEGHHITEMNGQYYKILTMLPAPLRFTLTATFPKEKQAELMLEGLIGPIIDKITIQEGIETGSVAEIKVKILKVPTSTSVKELRKYADVYEYGVVQNKSQHLIIVKKTEEHVSKGDSVLIIVNRLDHGRHLLSDFYQKNIPTKFVEGEISAREREVIKGELNQKKIKVVIATTVWKEGVNIPELNVVINAAGGKSEIATLQAIGRGLRKTATKNELVLYDLFDNSHHYLIEHFGFRISLYTEMEWI